MASTTTPKTTLDVDTYTTHHPVKPLPTDPSLRADILHVLTHGYVILPDSFTRAEAAEARAEIDRLSGPQPLKGRNAFEGANTNRIYSLLNKTRVFDKFATLPRVLALNEYFLETGYLISAFHTIVINPGEKAQRLHHDDEYIRVQRPRRWFGTAVMVAFDAYTATNGATRVVPGSHRWGPQEERRPQETETVKAVCPEGSVVYFVSTLWHGGGANVSDRPRKSATVQYCQPYIRPIENQILAVDPRKLDDIDPRIVDMMGYKVLEPFMGYGEWDFFSTLAFFFFVFEGVTFLGGKVCVP
jgi:hypothetical protein